MANADIGDLIYADTNGDGELTPDDRIVFEDTTTPRISFGLNLGTQYKGFEINAFFQGQSNVSKENRTLFNGALNSSNAPAYFLKNAYTLDTPNSSLPRIGDAESTRNGYAGGANASTFWQRDASFVRLKNLEIAYSLPKDLLSKIKVDNLRLFISGTNLLTFDKYKNDGLGDPENGNELNWAIPFQKVFNLGLNVTF